MWTGGGTFSTHMQSLETGSPVGQLPSKCQRLRITLVPLSLVARMMGECGQVRHRNTDAFKGITERRSHGS